MLLLQDLNVCSAYYDDPTDPNFKIPDDPRPPNSGEPKVDSVDMFPDDNPNPGLIYPDAPPPPDFLAADSFSKDICKKENIA